MKPRPVTMLRTAILAAWAAWMAWYIRFEAFPERFTHTLDGYRATLSEGRLFADSWMKILWAGNPIGMSHTSIETADGDPVEHYRIQNRTVLALNLMGQAQHVTVSSSAGLDVLYHLQRFTFSMNARHYAIRIEGRREAGDRFRVTTRTDAGSATSSVEIPDDVIVYSPLIEMAMSRLKPGEFIRVRTLDPASLTLGDATVRALRREQISLGGREVDALALTVEYQGMSLPTWVDDVGRILRQDTPLGWTLESCSAEEAMALKLDAGRMDDLLLATAVPCQGDIPDPESVGWLRLRMHGAPMDGLALASERQVVESLAPQESILRVRPARWPDAVEETASDRTEWLRPSTFVQSDHPDIARRAREIVRDAADEKARALAIYSWVHRNVVKKPTVSLPSALDVLKRMEGDCNEHTYLFVALARAAGIPARIRVGLVFKDGVFYYHAWPSVFVHGWTEMDPTIGQPLADATHVALLDGELAAQMGLLAVFGRLRVEVLDLQREEESHD